MADPVIPFASVQDLKDRWPDFPTGGENAAAVQLEDASQFILDVCPQASRASENTRRRVVCSVVRRAMQAGTSDMVGLSSAQVTTGPFSATYQSANPNGDFYLTKQELKALGGGGRPKAYGVQIVDDAATVAHRPWCTIRFAGGYCSCGADLTLADPLWEA